MTAAIVEGVRRELDPDTSLVAKLSYLNERRLAELIREIAPMIDGVSGINTLQCKVRRADGQPTFPGRQLAGVSGIAVREYAHRFVAGLARLRVETGHYFEIVGMGGVTDPASFRGLFDLGANVVQTASGAFANPFLALECVENSGEVLPEVASVMDPPLQASLRSMIVNSLRSAERLSKFEIAEALPLRARQSYLLLEAMEAAGDIAPVVGKPATFELPRQHASPGASTS
ncbi:hypothetical protein [Blastococcus brunescens]|uniref:Uncharacterized protein n=1 Tax=Blastococcus brunescens TaxID=1564165 RepID=A0ABZ1B5Z8_9ACTN|nr:hypothetical protein [Blastococcus sp. BMG 8361]WRL66221.1 hypothetical protein U6N30_12520 [Blastococcus sp. BMG 8361]